MQYFHSPLTNYTNYPIYNTHIYNNYELENQVGITSCINYPICNTYFKGDAKTNSCSSKPISSGSSHSKCNTHIGIMRKPHVKHDTCYIHM
jgi:hypothetical protein